MNRLRKYFYLIILYAFTAAAYTHPQNSFAQEKPVEINAKSMGSFTRVEIKGEKNFKVNQKEGRLVIRFPAPVDLSLGGLRASLDQVIDSVNLSPNHKSITIELNGRFKTREFLGSKYAGFDLIRIGEAPIKTAHKSPSIDKAAKPEKAIPDEGIKPQINTKAASKPEVSKPEKVVVNTSAIAENDKLRISFKWPVVAK